MIPILMAPGATDFSTNGVGRLSDAISCIVREERNGEFELEMQYPLSGAHFDAIVHSAVIVAKPSARRDLQAFRVYKISKPLNGRVTVYAQHISYQMSFIPVSPFSAQSLAAALAGFKTNAAESCPFTLSADFTSSSSYAVPLPTSIRSYLGGQAGSILDVYGGEWEWDNYSAILHRSRGQDNGYTIMYGKNLVDLKQEENIADTYTGIYPYWTADGTTVTLPEKVIHSANASLYPFQRTIVKDFSDQFAGLPTVAQLRTYTQSYITRNNIGIPSVSIDLDFVNLADLPEYKDLLNGANVDLCDTVTVRFEKLGVDATAKIIGIEWNVLKDRYDSLSIGEKRSTLTTTLEDQFDQIAQAATVGDVTRKVDRATGVLNAGTRGHVIINRNSGGWANEILFLDNENVALAQNVLRINQNGIGFSSTGYQGNYYQAWTIDGHLALGGLNNAYGDFEILDGSGKPLGEWDKDGLRLYDSASNVIMRLNHGGLFLYNASGSTLAQLTPSGVNVYNGSIQGGSINIANKFIVDAQGNMTATSGKFTGELDAATLKSCTIDGQGGLSAGSHFWVSYFSDEDEDYDIGVGGFGYYFEDGDHVFSNAPYGDKNMFLVNSGTGKIYCNDIIPYTNGQRWQHGLAYWVDWLYNAVVSGRYSGGGDDSGGDDGPVDPDLDGPVEDDRT